MKNKLIPRNKRSKLLVLVFEVTGNVKSATSTSWL